MKKEETGFDPKAFLKTAPSLPGVYRMLNSQEEILYVGKAKNIKKRVASYFRNTGLSSKTISLVQQIQQIECTITHTESEALILEHHLIKQHKPRYNILLRDDKSYPYIFVSTQQEFPRLAYHRGAQKAKGRYFGPFPSAGSAKESLKILQKIFPIRQCEDSYFQNRTRPCLQYQIKRCSGPCVGLVSKEKYQSDLHYSLLFLEGKNHELIDELAHKMDVASKQLAFEEAAQYRDQIVHLRRVQEKQHVSGEQGNLDIIAVMVKEGIASVQVFFIRGGRNLGNKSFFPKMGLEESASEVLEAFLPQYYLVHTPPAEILLNTRLENKKIYEDVLSEQVAHKVVIKDSTRGERARWLEIANQNASYALDTKLASKQTIETRYESLRKLLELAEIPQRMECFDISHTSGEATIASCVVFDREGPAKSLYRRMNIKDIAPGDDYAAMEQAIRRRFQKCVGHPESLPDVLFIDGGKGQLGKAEQVFIELGISPQRVVAVAKGVDRKPGFETIIQSGKGVLSVKADEPALHLIQLIRDESHRFAISGHRARRGKVRMESVLQSIPGLGPKRRQDLLRKFGGLQEVARAGVEDLASVSGISIELAQKIYDLFHEQ